MQLVYNHTPDFQPSFFYEHLNVRYGCNRQSYNTRVASYRTNIKSYVSDVGRDSSVSIATRYRLDGLGIESQWG